MPDIVAAENPELANQIVNKILSGEAAEPAEPESGVAFTDLPDTYVTLPGGYLTSDGELIRHAEVRELTGFDEEALSRATTLGMQMNILLSRAVVAVGTLKPDQGLLNALLAADRDALLLAIRQVTWGSDVVLGAFCGACETEQELTVDLTTDVEVKRLDGPADREFSVSLLRGRTATVQLPNGETQRSILQSEDKTSAELNTLLLKGCIIAVDGEPVFTVDQVRKLPLRDRVTILEEISKRNPGPRLNEVSKPCSACGEEIPLPLTLAGLFRL